MTVRFGWAPLDFVLDLAWDGDFVFTLQGKNAQTSALQNWPAGTTIEFRFYRAEDPRDDIEPPIVWPAMIVGANANWDVPAADVNEILTEKALYPRLRYAESDGSTIVWMRGYVNAT